MYILLVNLTNDLLELDIYKLYRNKKIVQEITAKIASVNEKEKHVLISNSNKVVLVDKSISFKSENSIEDCLKQVLRHEKLIKYEFNYVVSKIKDGGTQYTNITLLHSKTVANLTKINTSPEQKSQLHISEYLHQVYKKGKHYLCFETGFYSTVNNSLQVNMQLPVNRCRGLYLSEISNKLAQYSPKAKKVWLIITIEAKYTIFTVIKKQVCLGSVRLKANLLENENPDHGNCLKVSIALAQMLTVIDEVHGIIINGSLGCTNNKVRRVILKPLNWSGILLNLKSTNYLISKKSSSLPIFCIKGNENEELLNQLISRL